MNLPGQSTSRCQGKFGSPSTIVNGGDLQSSARVKVSGSRTRPSLSDHVGPAGGVGVRDNVATGRPFAEGQRAELTKKGFRRIVVDGVEYRWRVSRNRRCCEYHLGTLGYVVEEAVCPGTALVVETGRPVAMELDSVPAELVLPSEVAAGIRAARSSGWMSRSDGSSFELRLSAAG
ncbi:hypothetical protein SAMN05428939_0788 [Streptomyces sp. TLI_105]|nr:hypothetical protein SAMN05428939_0788 [Streptomyces sp. TLI_105]